MRVSGVEGRIVESVGKDWGQRCKTSYLEIGGPGVKV